VLGTVLMALQRESGAGVNGNSLDEKAITRVQPFVGTPGTVYATVQQVLIPFHLFELINDLFDLLHLILGGNQYGIGRLHDDDILQSDTGN
jgi:hypothetical protein